MRLRIRIIGSLIMVLTLASAPLMSSDLKKQRDADVPALQFSADLSQIAQFADVIWTQPEVLLDIARPTHTSRRAVRNRHDDSITDYISTFQFDGWQVRYYHAASNEKPLLLQLSLQKNNADLPAGTRLGQSQKSLLLAMGEPDQIDGNLLCYEQDLSALVFEIENGLVRQLTWTWFVE